jgi:hypothetical protein
MIQGRTMLRWTMPLLAAVLMAGTASAADLADGTSVYRKAPPRHVRITKVEKDPDVLFTPSDGVIPAVHIPPFTPLMPGRATLPGYYGSFHSYEDTGPYYGGSGLSYFWRLPYACGVYGYC